MSEVLDISALKQKIFRFAAEREWEKFHSPKNLAMALSVEAAELLEIFQWLTEKESHELVDKEKYEETRREIEEEVADIVVYATRICGVLDINLASAIDRKMELNAKKYPVEKARGNSTKYTKF